MLGPFGGAESAAEGDVGIEKKVGEALPRFGDAGTGGFFQCLPLLSEEGNVMQHSF